MKTIVLSGRSGTGKSVALKSLEDLGFNCIDNMPCELLPGILSTSFNVPTAISIDSRNIHTEESILQIIDIIKNNNQIELLMLDANDSEILRRFTETRHKHPLTNDKISLKEAINIEKELLEAFHIEADLLIDTSTLTQYELKTLLSTRVTKSTSGKMQILLQSFGFKHGTPSFSDFIFDVRSLPNPYWQPEIRKLNGLDEKIIQFFESSDDAENTVEDLKQFLLATLARFSPDHRSYITISIGCTGGKHRSVYVTEKLYKLLAKHFTDFDFLIDHCHIDQAPAIVS